MGARHPTPDTRGQILVISSRCRNHLPFKGLVPDAETAFLVVVLEFTGLASRQLDFGQLRRSKEVGLGMMFGNRVGIGGSRQGVHDQGRSHGEDRHTHQHLNQREPRSTA